MTCSNDAVDCWVPVYFDTATVIVVIALQKVVPVIIFPWDEEAFVQCSCLASVEEDH